MAGRIYQGGVSGIRAAFADATRQLEAERSFPPDPDPNMPRDGIKPGEWDGAPWDSLPPGCPVQVLGHDGDVTYCVSATGQLHEISRWDAAVLHRLFAPQLNYAYWAWPGWGDEKHVEDGEEKKVRRVKRLERDKAGACLISEGARMGLFDPTDRVRGRGGWKLSNGGFLWHSGEWLWRVEDKAGRSQLTAAKPQALDGMLYTRAPDVMIPWQEPVAAADSPAQQLLDDLGSWNWERPFLDPVLLLGWFGNGFFGGALDWRPTVFATGGKGVGKSTIQRILQALYGRAVHDTADTTAAGIYQRVKQDSLPVMVDELEARSDNRKAMAVIELARLAASGARLYRGGADHEGTSFQARNCFLFSAINAPPLKAQDKSRMAILNLTRLDRNRGMQKEPVIQAEWGRMILRQLMDGWIELQTRILPDWRKTLHLAGFDSRAIDTYGTLLATAELLVGPEKLASIGLPVDDQQRLGEVIKGATALERAEQLDNWETCIERLLDSTINNWKSGEKPTVGAVLEELERDNLGIQFARERLVHAGLGVRAVGDPGTGYCLAVPMTANNPALLEIFRDTEFADGVWTSALKQAPADIVLRGAGNKMNVKIGRSTKYCLLIDLGAYDRHMARRWGDEE